MGRRSSAGDTIVEVLMAMAVASLVLTTAYTTATHTLANTRQAQEHTEALNIAQGQVEQLGVSKSYSCPSGSMPSSSPITIGTTCSSSAVVYGDGSTNCAAGTVPVGGNCLSPATEQTVDPQTTWGTNPFCMDSSDRAIAFSAATCKVSKPGYDYTYKITYAPATKAYTVHVQWPSVVGGGNDSVDQLYKVSMQ